MWVSALPIITSISHKTAVRFCMPFFPNSIAWVASAILAFSFSAMSPVLAQQGPSLDVSVIPKPISDTLDRVQMRDALNQDPTGRATQIDDTCLLPPLTFVHSPLVSATALAVPAKAKKEYLSACEALKEKKTDIAEKRLRKAVQEYFKYSAAWVTLGQVLATQDHTDEARSACSQGSTVEPNYIAAYLCLADLAAREKNWGDVLQLSNWALALDPATTAIAYEYNAAANLRINRLDDAEKSALRVLAIDKNKSDPRVHFLLAQIYEAKGDRIQEIVQLREYVEVAKNPEDVAAVQQVRSQLEKPGVSLADPQNEHRNAVGASRESVAVPEKLMGSARIDEGPSSCHLDTLLPQIEHRIQEFVVDVQKFTATELLVYESLNGSGQVAYSELSKYDYLVQIEQSGPGLLAVNEYQHSRSASEKSRVTLVTTGLPALPLIFHPYYAGDFSMDCEGLTNFNGKPAWQIHFRQRDDRPSRIRSYRIGLSGRAYVLDLEGRAWFLAENNQIVKLETDLVKTIPEIQLALDHASAEYGPVHFQSRGIDVWLLVAAEFVCERKGKRTYELVTFTDYLLFAIDDQQQITTPKIQKEHLIQQLVARDTGNPQPPHVN
jgi:tetratricopeptide (TPR) repeat protein